jgi:ABC-type polysaccharide/polyol phosphate export permease
VFNVGAEARASSLARDALGVVMTKTISSLMNLLIAFILIYVGVTVLYSVNPFLGILFVIFALYILISAIRGGSDEF